jgi:hypothetical protein
MSKHHIRRGRIWQFFFTGWGLFCTIILLMSPFIFKNITWTILDSINMSSIEQNNLSITNLMLSGVNKDGDPFAIKASTALQKFDEPDATYFENPVATVVRVKNGAKVRDEITALRGKFLNDQQKIILSRNVRIKSSDGTTTTANEMEIDLK